jgi:DNA-binding NarL/FixJ family response regulator
VGSHLAMQPRCVLNSRWVSPVDGSGAPPSTENGAPAPERGPSEPGRSAASSRRLDNQRVSSAKCELLVPRSVSVPSSASRAPTVRLRSAMLPHRLAQSTDHAGGLNGSAQHFLDVKGVVVARGYVRLGAEQTDAIWSRLQLGMAAKPVARELGLSEGTVPAYLVRCGGIRPLPRRRRVSRLELREREEISRGLAAGLSLRVIAAQLGRAPSTISREVAGNGGRRSYRALRADRVAWATCGPGLLGLDGTAEVMGNPPAARCA